MRGVSILIRVPEDMWPMIMDNNGLLQVGCLAADSSGTAQEVEAGNKLPACTQRLAVDKDTLLRVMLDERQIITELLRKLEELIDVTIMNYAPGAKPND